MKNSKFSLSTLLSSTLEKEYSASEETSPLELTEREKRIVKVFIHRLGILYTIEGFILAIVVFALIFSVLFMGISLLFSLVS